VRIELLPMRKYSCAAEMHAAHKVRIARMTAPMRPTAKQTAPELAPPPEPAGPIEPTADMFRTAELMLAGNPMRMRIPTWAVVRVVARAHGIDVAEVMGVSRMQRLVAARRQLCWIARAFGHPFVLIGKRINLHHTTVLHHCRFVTARIEHDAELRAQLRFLIAAIIAEDSAGLPSSRQ
jgi:DnaA-like protein